MRQSGSDDVLDRVAGDRDDHQPDERLGDPERRHRRLERLDEPVRDEGRAAGRRGEHAERQRQRPGPVSDRRLDRRWRRARRAIENGIDAANTTSRTIETNTLRSCA